MNTKSKAGFHPLGHIVIDGDEVCQQVIDNDKPVLFHGTSATLFRSCEEAQEAIRLTRAARPDMKTDAMTIKAVIAASAT